MDSLKEKMYPVLLPTNKRSVLIISGKELMFAPYNTTWVNTENAQHLYICSNREIKEGDYRFHEGQNNVELANTVDIKTGYYKSRGSIYKVVASTDKSLGLPEPSKEFIEAYIKAFNSGSPITEVMVEMEYGCKNGHTMHYKAVCRYPFCDEQTHLVPYVKSDNTITITKVVEDWDDLYNKFQNYLKEAELKKSPDIVRNFHQWLKKENYLPPVKIK